VVKGKDIKYVERRYSFVSDFCVCVCVCTHTHTHTHTHDGVSKSCRTGRLKRELQMIQLSATRCSCIAILWASLVSFAAITLCVASQRVFIVVVYSLSTQSGNFWIQPRIGNCLYARTGLKINGKETANVFVSCYQNEWQMPNKSFETIAKFKYLWMRVTVKLKEPYLGNIWYHWIICRPTHLLPNNLTTDIDKTILIFLVIPQSV
jgi:hypothetical protein